MAAATIVATHNVIGKVTGTSTRPFTSKAGKSFIKTIISVDGNEIELDGLGDKTAMYPAGKEVQLGAAKAFGTWKQAGSAVPGLPMISATVAHAATPGVPVGGMPARTRGSFPIAGDDYQQSIIRQNSLTNAVNTVAAIIREFSTEELSPKDSDDRLPLTKLVEATSEHIIRLAYRYSAFSSGRLDAEAMQQIAEKALGSLYKE